MRKAIVSFILAIVIISVWVVVPFPIHKIENRCAHISIDDVEVCMKHLANDSQKYESLFEEPFFHLLQTLHSSFGAKFTLYIYAEANNYDIADIPLKFKNEFIANAEWLKFGFHAIRPQYNITVTANTDSFITAFNKVNRHIIRFGDSLSLSHILRLHYFYATVEERVRIAIGGG